jgi:hypothetical protein
MSAHLDDGAGDMGFFIPLGQGTVSTLTGDATGRASEHANSIDCFVRVPTRDGIPTKKKKRKPIKSSHYSMPNGYG